LYDIGFNKGFNGIRGFRLASLLPPGFTVEGVDMGDATTVIPVRAAIAAGMCPMCGRLSSRIRSRYHRRLADLPVGAWYSSWSWRVGFIAPMFCVTAGFLPSGSRNRDHGRVEPRGWMQSCTISAWRSAAGGEFCRAAHDPAQQ
jgi:hypothetical protein